MDLKYCEKCGTETERRLSDGRCAPCRRATSRQSQKTCRQQRNANQAVWRKANPEKVRAIQRKWWLANREEKNARKRQRDADLKAQVYAHYGSFCVCCGETESSFLELDHVNNDGNSQRKLHGGTTTLYRRLLRKGFPNDLQVLCSNCNRSKQLSGGTCAHQKFSVLKLVS